MNMKKFFGVTVLAGTFLINSNAALAQNDRETINQVALLQSLALGHFEGSITVKEWKTYGDTGIGTFDGLNGELIALNECAKKEGVNSFYMVKIPAEYSQILIRSEAKQNKPYPTLVEAFQATQNEVTLNNVRGTIVGLYCPDFMNSLNSVGWHFHFISADKKFAGHVLEMSVTSGEAQFDKTGKFAMRLPANKDFQGLNFKTDLREDIRKAENDTRSE